MNKPLAAKAPMIAHPWGHSWARPAEPGMAGFWVFSSLYTGAFLLAAAAGIWLLVSGWTAR